MKLLFTLLLTLSLFANASCQNRKLFKELRLLAGTWRMETPRGPLFEEWKVVNKKAMNGKSYKLNGRDTLLLENIKLIKNTSGFYYIPTVSDQNNKQPVPFKMINNQNSSFTFENKQHDFPQRIIYKIVNRDSVVARIEGTKGGKESYSDFFYKRLK